MRRNTWGVTIRPRLTTVSPSSFRVADHSARCKQYFYQGVRVILRTQEVELQSELDNSRIAACRDDATKIACI